MDGRTGQSGESVLLSALSPEERRALMAGARPVSYPAGQTIFAEGEPGAFLVLIADGRVEISLTALSGRKAVLDQLGPGDVLGEIAVLDGSARSADALAVTEVQGQLLLRQHVMGFLHDEPSAAHAIIVELCRKIRATNEMISNQTQVRANVRLARGLLRLAARWGRPQKDGSVRLSEAFSQTELGDFTGLARENVNRLLRQWETDGLVLLEERRLVLLDLPELEGIAQL